MLAQVLSKRFRIESKLHEDVHLLGLLAHHKLAVICGRKLIQSEEAQVGKDLVQNVIVAVGAARASLEENFRKNLDNKSNKSQ